MSGPSPTELLFDPLSDVARKERRNLLIASAAGILVATMGLVPTRLSILGIEFSPPEQNYFVIFVASFIAYFVVAFVVYGVSDFLISRNKHHDHLVAVAVEMQGWTEKDQHDFDELHTNIPCINQLYVSSKRVFFLRTILEFLFPILVGGISVCLLLWKAWHS